MLYRGRVDRGQRRGWVVSLWSRLLGRKRPPVIIDRREYNDWRVGNLAVCVNDDWTEEAPPHIPLPKIGEIFRVREIRDRVGLMNCRCYFLYFESPFDYGYESRNFRKAVEDNRAAETEFTALIKRPARKPVRAA